MDTSLEEMRQSARFHTLSKVEVHPRQCDKAVKAWIVPDGDINGFGRPLPVYLHRVSRKFFTHLPDGRQVISETYEHLVSGAKLLLREATDVGWKPYIVVSRKEYNEFGARDGSPEPEDAYMMLKTGEIPDWVYPGVALDVRRIYLGHRAGTDGNIETLELRWDHYQADDDPWHVLQLASRYHGPTPGLLARARARNHRGAPTGEPFLIATACIDYTDDLWERVQNLQHELRRFHCMISALFYSDDGQVTLLQQRLEAASSNLLSVRDAND
jgi:hypothetical protein